jgi:4-alpha-glucanotransferase
MIDWMSRIGFDVIQLLPLNDTGHDTSPYGCLSAFALNPLHLGLSQLPYVDGYPNLSELLRELQAATKTQRIHYSYVRELKNRFLRLYYSWEYPRIAESVHYRAFVEGQHWLRDYSLFKTLKNVHHGQLWEMWPTELRERDPSALAAVEKRYVNEIQYHEFLQYLCAQQLQAVKEHATKAKVFLKGDLPILIGRESADFWAYRHLFEWELAAGAPPDMYAPQGQKWGFPLPNWEAMEAEGHRWWHERLAVASHYYHIYRIDHVVGFFRLFAIPHDKTPKEGFLLPHDESLWIKQGQHLLEMLIQSSPMLPIGEDLGVIPNGVRECLKHLGICGTKVMRWERDWEGSGDFIPLNNYAMESMTTVSTHDSETLAGWWLSHPEDARRLCRARHWHYFPHLSRDHRIEILHASHHSGSLFHINLLQEYLALFPDWVSSAPQEERINIPGLVSEHNWSYRYRPTVEQIVTHEPLAEAMATLIS